jgi:hypothetical protein
MPRIAGRQKRKAVAHGAGCPAPLSSSDGKWTWVDAALAISHSPKRSRDRKQASKPDAEYYVDAAFPFTPVARRRSNTGRRETARNSAVLFSQQRAISVEIAEPSDGAHPTRCCADRPGRAVPPSAERSVSSRRNSVRMTAHHVRRDKAALFQWVQSPPGDRSSPKQPGQAWRRRNV